MSRLAETLRALQRKRQFNPQYGRQAVLLAAMADAESASQRLASGKRLDLEEKKQAQQREQFAEQLAFSRERFAQTLAEQKRAALVMEQQTRELREAQINAASKARTLDYINMGLQAPLYGYSTYKLWK